MPATIVFQLNNSIQPFRVTNEIQGISLDPPNPHEYHNINICIVIN